MKKYIIYIYILKFNGPEYMFSIVHVSSGIMKPFFDAELALLFDRKI